jgi:hypothetical protein
MLLITEERCTARRQHCYGTSLRDNMADNEKVHLSAQYRMSRGALKRPAHYVVARHANIV